MPLAPLPRETAMIAGFRAKPHHVGSIHDDGSARQFGYRSALVPGIILYGYMANLVATAWGLDWVAHGSMNSRSRRPVYEGDAITIMAGPVQPEGDGWAVEMTLHDAEGRVAATGRAGLPSQPAPAPDLSAFPVQPIDAELRPIAAGAFRPGDRFGCAPELMTPEAHDESLTDFRQTWPVYAAQGVVHPTKYPQFVTRNALASYKLPTPSIYVEATTRHLGIARIGDRLSCSGAVTAVYERKGNHYTEQRHLVIANDATPIALVDRVSIYAARKGA